MNNIENFDFSSLNTEEGNKQGITIHVPANSVKTMLIEITGDSDLILNKMNDVSARKLIKQRKDETQDLEKPNPWEAIITSMHWYNGKPTDFSENGLKDALDPNNNAPCITTFGLRMSFADSVVRNEVDKYSTKFKATVNINSKGGLVPIKFTQHYLDEMLMSPKKGAPILSSLNRFTGWSATFCLQFLETAYSAEQLLNVINLAGFGIGIGSGRSSGYGRYHISNVAMIG